MRIVFFAVTAIIYSIVNAMTYNEIFPAFQQGGYRIREYYGWLKRKGCSVFLKSIALVVVYVLTYYAARRFIQIDHSGEIVSGIVLTGLSVIFLLKRKHIVKITITKRFLRCFILLSSLCAAIDLFVFYTLGAVFAVTFVIYPFLPAIVCVILYPYEKIRYDSYIGKAERKLRSLDPVVIGITGSYGKTSVKKYLSEMLSVKYSVAKTPGSFNTPLGICRSIENLTGKEEIFVVELGARRRGDIEEICKFVRPDVGIITAVGEQHLETFGNIENVKNTKYELIESLPDDAPSYFCTDTEGAYDLYKKAPSPKFSIGFKSNSDACITDYRITDKQSVFELFYDNKKYLLKTKLLGRHNVSDVALAFLVALNFGVDPEKLSDVCETLEPEEHRLKIVREDRITVIDDSYNANPVGVECAAEVLSFFEGRKIAITPGLVECGKDAERLNVKAAQVLGDVCDEVIVYGSNSEYFISLSGSVKARFKRAADRDDATETIKKILKEGDVVIYINDLPDLY